MGENARYYLARLLKSGRVTSESISDAIVNPVVITQGSYLYTFTNIVRDPANRYVFANLAKYLPTGEIEVVEPEAHVAKPAAVPNLQVARSPFVYVPQFSAVAYQHVWNKLQREQFEAAFARLVVEKHERFFAECRLEAISDLITFVQKVSEIEVITRLEATVRPPNPLFSPLWRSLQEYMRGRNVDEVHVREKAATPDGVGTRVTEFARQAVSRSETEGEQAQEPTETPGLTDAAILMAADGYGKAKVEGIRRKAHVVFRTQEFQIGFDFPKEPEPEALYETTHQVLMRVGRERQLDHE